MGHGNQLRTFGHLATSGSKKMTNGDPWGLMSPLGDFIWQFRFVLPAHRKASLANDLSEFVVGVVIQVQDEAKTIQQWSDQPVRIGRRSNQREIAHGNRLNALAGTYADPPLVQDHQQLVLDVRLQKVDFIEEENPLAGF